MEYIVHYGKVKDFVPYTMNAKQGDAVIIDGLQNVKAFAGGKLKRLKAGCYWGIINDIEYYAEKAD